MIDYDRKHDMLYIIVEDETNSGDNHNDDIIKFTGFSISEIAKKIDLQPVVHAHWQPYEDTVQCSECGFGTFMDGYFFDHGECTHADDRSFRFSFCPNCGAKMDEEGLALAKLTKNAFGEENIAKLQKYLTITDYKNKKEN